MSNLSAEQHFNKLTPAEAELLALLAEECGEVVQAVGKILRHGLEFHHPASGITNRANLETEMGDLRSAMILLCQNGVTSKAEVHEAAHDKLARVERWLHHAKVKP